MGELMAHGNPTGIVRTVPVKLKAAAIDEID
jgi:hypothetical protein